MPRELQEPAAHDVQESEELFRLVVNSIEDYGILVLDPHGFVQSWNVGAERMSGYRADEVLARHFSLFYTEEATQRDWPAQLLAKAAAAGRYEDEGWRVRKDGSRFWANVVITPLRDEGGELRGYSTVTRDLTERRQAEEALRASEQQFRALSQSANDAIVSADSTGTIIFWNKAASEIFGYTEKEVLHQPLTILMPESFREAHLAGLARFQATGVPRVVGKTVELRGRNKDGREFPIELSLAAWQLGEQRFFTGVIRDITARKKAEQALEARAQQQTVVADFGQRALAGIETKALMHEAASLIATTLELDLAGVMELLPDSNSLVLRAGKGWKKGCLGHSRVGADAASQAGYTLLQGEAVIVEDVRIEKRFQISRLLKNHGVVSGLTVVIAGQGRPFGVLGAHMTQPRTFSADDVHFVQAIANVLAATLERTQAEATLRTFTKQLQASNRELEQFASIASHDLQEPLRKIQAFGDMLQAKYAETLGEQGREYLARVQTSAARMRTLIEDLLAFSRLTSKSRHVEHVALGVVAREVISDLETRIQQTGATVNVGNLPTIEADPTQMRQLLQNLIGNALKFHRPDQPPVIYITGQLLGDVASVMADGDLSEVRCQLTVTDNGIGFEPAYASRIFEVFQRLHARHEYEGTGMGLAICRKIAERHYGEISVTSQPQHGATFIVTLPVKQPKEFAPHG